MRKLILISALLAASVTFAQAGETRSLSLTGVAITEPAKPITEVSIKLAQAAAPAETAAPVQAQTQAPAPATTTATPAATDETTPAAKTTEAKPSKPAKKVARESDEHKARRIAAKYGVYW
jgi:hypothetical protein